MEAGSAGGSPVLLCVCVLDPEGFMCVCVYVYPGVAVKGAEGHGSHLLLSRPEQPAQQHSQIPRRLHPLVQILIAHQQLQSHLPAATRQGRASRLI